jgi:hypothetical protein
MSAACSLLSMASFVGARDRDLGLGSVVVDLVVAPASRKSRQLMRVFGEPRGLFGEMDKAVLDHRGLIVARGSRRIWQLFKQAQARGPEYQ